MRNGYLDPAYSIIQKLGGLRRAVEASGASESRVYRWQLPKDRGGTDGLIPTKRQQKILDWAAQEAIDLGPADFFVARAKVPARRVKPNGSSRTAHAGR